MFARNIATLLSASILLSLSVHTQPLYINYHYLLPSFNSHVLPPSPNQSVKLQTVLGSGTGKCLAATSFANGAPVVIEDCGTNSTSLNSWASSGGSDAQGQLGLNSQYVRLSCINLTDGNLTAGNQVAETNVAASVDLHL
ncbi:hypothetical protein B0H14DRAFT_2597044 [Mycena olivaceomarginata]|nr:hypothetical protein B0H14DRAFT_2597044 [Mycena olivaceomarginata]